MYPSDLFPKAPGVPQVPAPYLSSPASLILYVVSVHFPTLRPVPVLTTTPTNRQILQVCAQAPQGSPPSPAA